MYNALTNKKPCGATAAGKKTDFVFPLPSDTDVRRVFVVMRKEGRELRFELDNIKRENGEILFCGGFVPEEPGIWRYRFEGELKEGGLAFFGRGSDGRAIRGDWLPEWQLTVAKVDYKTPNWAKSGVIYQIFADRFCKSGDGVFDKNGRLHSDWYERPDVEEEGEEYRADDFFGGNAEGIVSKLDYLKSLNVSLIYLSPIFESASNHRYDTGDYLKIDPLFGDEEAFKRLVSEADKRGMKIMLDGVFNHTGADSLYFNKFGNYPSLGAYQSKDSPYYGWYYFYEFPDDYHCWWGSTVVPTVNKSAAGYRELIMGRDGVIERWTGTGVKAWRLDVADELPIEFTTALCKKIRSVDPDALIVGEVWEDASEKVSYGELRPYFMGEQLDSVMNYPFKRAITDYVLNNDIEGFVSSVVRIIENYPKESLDTLLNLIDSHDTVRALTLLSGVSAPKSKSERAQFRLDDKRKQTAVKRLKLASALQYTLPGVPCLYYGDEAGAEGFEDPMNRGTYPWGRENCELLAHYRALGNLRAQHADALRGDTRFIKHDRLLVFERASRGEAITVIANASEREEAYDIEGRDAFSGEKISRVSVLPCSAAVIVSGPSDN